MSKKILVIGYGNPLRRDDGAGLVAVERLQNISTYPNCKFMTAHQLQPEMIADFAAADVVLLVDAAASLQPGVTGCVAVSDSNINTSMTHFMTPQWMLWLCQQLYGCKPQAYVFTIGGYDFGYGEGLSAIVKLRLKRLVALIAKTISQVAEEKQGVWYEGT